MTITDFKMFDEIENIITYFKLVEKDKLIKYSDEIELILLSFQSLRKMKMN